VCSPYEFPFLFSQAIIGKKKREEYMFETKEKPAGLTEPPDLIIEAPAKINLTLDIKGKRPDGYHELETVMHQIDLVDRICLTLTGTGIKVASNSGLIPDDERNLAYKAASLLKKKYGLKKGVEIFIEKNIPVEAGLAGGSTDAAAVLTGLNQLLELGLSRQEIMGLAAEAGSDVPFCVLGGTALARGRGEILQPLAEGPSLKIVLVKPDFSLSTREVFEDFRLENIDTSPDTPAFLAAWENYDIINVAQLLNNVLESVSLVQRPEIAGIKQQLCELGALNALMSGSGPSVFAVFHNHSDAEQAFMKMKEQYKESYLLSSYRKGDTHDEGTPCAS